MSESVHTRPLTVLMSGANWDGVRGSERALTESLREYTDVLWVDPPVSPATPKRYRRFSESGPAWRPSLTEPMPGVWRLAPVVLPGLTRPVVRATTWPLVRRQVRAAVAGLGRTPFAVLACSLDDVLRGWSAGTTTVLYGTDDWVAGAGLMGLPADRLIRAERRAVAAADVVLTVTPKLAQRWRRLGADPVLLPNACDPDAYLTVDTVPPAALPAGFPDRVAGVVGQLNDRLSVELLTAVADTGIGLLLVGPHDPGWLPDTWAALVARPNVHHTGGVPFAELPGWLARMDVGLTPYADTDFNQASFPLKTLEYLAAGRPAVCADLPATRALAAESTDVTVATGPAGFASAVVAAAELPRTPEAVARRRRIVTVRFSWASRATRLAGLLGLPTDPESYRQPGRHRAADTATNSPAIPMHRVTDRTTGHPDLPRRAG
jgi:teichuronic acid biosynthesis glycosyltransferase TuaH